MKHPLDKIAEAWKDAEEKYFSGQPLSSDFFELELQGNPRTGSQINEWVSAGVIQMNKELDHWDWTKPYQPTFTGEPEINKFDRLLSSNTNPDSLPELGYMELYKSSKLTDFITGSFMQQYGLIISRAAKEILEQYNLGEAKFYPLTLKHKDTFYNDYFFFKTLSSGVDFIDYEQSLFYHQNGLLEFDTRKDTEINSFQDVEKHYKKSNADAVYLFIKKMVLTDNFPNFDYFTFYNYGVHKRFISVKLATALKKTTGLKIKQTNRIFR